MAREKARVVAASEHGETVLAADTTVVLRGAVFEKPHTPAEAAAMLSQLAGRTHQVMTAVAGAPGGRARHAPPRTPGTVRPPSARSNAPYRTSAQPHAQ